MSKWFPRGVGSPGFWTRMNSFLSLILAKMTYVKVSQEDGVLSHPERLDLPVSAIRILTY